MKFEAGTTKKTIQLKSGATNLNTAVVVSCVTDNSFNITNPVAYHIDSSGLLTIVTTSRGGDIVSYIVKYLF